MLVLTLWAVDIFPADECRYAVYVCYACSLGCFFTMAGRSICQRCICRSLCTTIYYDPFANWIYQMLFAVRGIRYLADLMASLFVNSARPGKPRHSCFGDDIDNRIGDTAQQ